MEQPVAIAGELVFSDAHTTVQVRMDLFRFTSSDEICWKVAEKSLRDMSQIERVVGIARDGSDGIHGTPGSEHHFSLEF